MTAFFVHFLYLCCDVMRGRGRESLLNDDFMSRWILLVSEQKPCCRCCNFKEKPGKRAVINCHSAWRSPLPPRCTVTAATSLVAPVRSNDRQSFIATCCPLHCDAPRSPDKTFPGFSFTLLDILQRTSITQVQFLHVHVHVIWICFYSILCR